MDENNIEGAQFYKELLYRALTEEPSSLSMEFKETEKAIKDESKYLDILFEEQLKKSPCIGRATNDTRSCLYRLNCFFIIFSRFNNYQ